MSQALEESRRMYEEQNRHAPPDERLEVSLNLQHVSHCTPVIYSI